jgi:hypothetical protein
VTTSVGGDFLRSGRERTIVSMEELKTPHYSEERKKVLPVDSEPAGRSVADHLLGSLDRIIRRHRSLALDNAQHSGLHAELIAAEVAHELAMARSALYGQ